MMADTQRKPRAQHEQSQALRNSSTSQSPTRFKRNLWWHESPSDKKIPLQPIPKFEAQPKIEAKSNWTPSVSQKKIETKKLKWEVQPVLNTHENIKHMPGGGKKRYPTQQLIWNTIPKIDTGFIYDTNGESKEPSSS